MLLNREMNSTISTILNVIWLVFGGLWLALGYFLAGIICCLLIITIPFGIASFRLAGFVIWPFGRTVVWQQQAGFWSLLGNIVWVIFFGWQMAIAHLVAGLLLCITIIGIPFGIACWKMVPLALLPLGRRVVPIDSVAADPYGIPRSPSTV